ncbi:UNVERIFIED_CONTAM: hypothetical protein Sradi_7149700 [Sesamum radiatum]|uniref:Reverse transcriptase n=1 Tax=Sesamum radiatum TaxID=300843 RepID=A0AAW2IX81_SESRA
MNEQVLHSYSADEVKTALFQMYPYKSPRSDVSAILRIKLVSKAIATKVKSFLSSDISKFQSDFLPGRLITDTVLIAYEINHYLAHKYWGSVGDVALKLDFSKAYDRVEWIFLERVLARGA